MSFLYAGLRREKHLHVFRQARWAERYEDNNPNRERRAAKKFFDEKTLFVAEPSVL